MPGRRVTGDLMTTSRRFETGMWLFLGTSITTLILAGTATWASHHVTETPWWLFVRGFTSYFSNHLYWVLSSVTIILVSLFLLSLILMSTSPEWATEPLNSAKD